MIAAAAISTALLADDSVTVAKLGPGSVDSTALGDDRLAYLHALLNTGSCEKIYSEFSIMVITLPTDSVISPIPLNTPY